MVLGIFVANPKYNPQIKLAEILFVNQHILNSYRINYVSFAQRKMFASNLFLT